MGIPYFNYNFVLPKKANETVVTGTGLCCRELLSDVLVGGVVAASRVEWIKIGDCREQSIQGTQGLQDDRGEQKL